MLRGVIVLVGLICGCAHGGPSIPNAQRAPAAVTEAEADYTSDVAGEREREKILKRQRTF